MEEKDPVTEAEKEGVGFGQPCGREVEDHSRRISVYGNFREVSPCPRDEIGAHVDVDCLLSVRDRVPSRRKRNIGRAWRNSGEGKIGK